MLTQMQLPGDIEWHFIGNLQSNKVKPLLSMSSTLVFILILFCVVLGVKQKAFSLCRFDLIQYDLNISICL